MRRVLLTRDLPPASLGVLKRRCSVMVHGGRAPMPRRLLLRGVRDIEGLVCFPYDTVDAEMLDAAPDLRVISTYSVGYDHIDIAYAQRRGIRIGYTPDVLTDATADLAVTLMLDLLRRITEGDRIIRSGGWREIYGAVDYVGVGISGKTLGIIGLGRIGRGVARRARALGMNVIYSSRTRHPAGLQKRLGIRQVGLRTLLGRSDVISLHTPYTPQTRHMVDSDFLGRMKRGAFLINTARGGIVDEAALVRALERGDIAGAALDVFESEPIGRRHPLVRMPNVVLAPHIGSSTIETRTEMGRITVQNLLLGLQGKKMIYEVE